MIIFFGSLDCDIGCTILCKVHFELNIYPFGNFFWVWKIKVYVSNFHLTFAKFLK
jgi:hypothetical protein